MVGHRLAQQRSKAAAKECRVKYQTQRSDKEKMEPDEKMRKKEKKKMKKNVQLCNEDLFFFISLTI